ncbi:hypothetical protein EDB19DRAFT_1331368 [Suillus lakei]|nr:hypothetical protein EDB19DRAFT_1331368 [Suillus lakei]
MLRAPSLSHCKRVRAHQSKIHRRGTWYVYQPSLHDLKSFMTVWLTYMKGYGLVYFPNLPCEFIRGMSFLCGVLHYTNEGQYVPFSLQFTFISKIELMSRIMFSVTYLRSTRVLSHSPLFHTVGERFDFDFHYTLPFTHSSCQLLLILTFIAPIMTSMESSRTFYNGMHLIPSVQGSFFWLIFAFLSQATQPHSIYRPLLAMGTLNPPHKLVYSKTELAGAYSLGPHRPYGQIYARLFRLTLMLQVFSNKWNLDSMFVKQSPRLTSHSVKST